MPQTGRAGFQLRRLLSAPGRFSSLDEIARFDGLELWSFRSVWFSRPDTLLATVEALVARAGSGDAAAALGAALQWIRRRLWSRWRVASGWSAGLRPVRCVYPARDAVASRGQLVTRSVYAAAPRGQRRGGGGG